MNESTVNILVEESSRLDVVIANNIETISRNQIQASIKETGCLCNGVIIKSPKHKVKTGDMLVFTPPTLRDCQWKSSNIKLNIIYEDDDILLINKPDGLVMHPGAGQTENTVANALLNYNPNAESIPRAGIVHRLDKDTSGICICAKTNNAYLKITQALQKREINRTYYALVHGEIFTHGEIEQPIGRHPKKRTSMAVTNNGKYAKTRYKVIEKYNNFTWLELALETGRTHQIRVHMSYIKHPIVGDALYNKPIHLYSGVTLEIIERVRKLNRQALHAYKLAFAHPTSGKQMEFKAPIPKPINEIKEILEEKIL